MANVINVSLIVNVIRVSLRANVINVILTNVVYTETEGVGG